MNDWISYKQPESSNSYFLAGALYWKIAGGLILIIMYIFRELDYIIGQLKVYPMLFIIALIVGVPFIIWLLRDRPTMHDVKIESESLFFRWKPDKITEIPRTNIIQIVYIEKGRNFKTDFYRIDINGINPPSVLIATDVGKKIYEWFYKNDAIKPSWAATISQ